MNKRSFSINLGISILMGVAALIIFQKTKYIEMRGEPREITYQEFQENWYLDSVTKKQVFNYELGGLVSISTMATLLVITNLKRK